jgi:hypothetical protein
LTNSRQNFGKNVTAQFYPFDDSGRAGLTITGYMDRSVVGFLLKASLKQTCFILALGEIFEKIQALLDIVRYTSSKTEQV